MSNNCTKKIFQKFILPLVVGFILCQYLPVEKHLGNGVMAGFYIATAVAADVTPAPLTPENKKLQAEFKRDRKDILFLMRRAMKTSDYFVAETVGRPYVSVGDPEFQKLYKQAANGYAEKQGAVDRRINALQSMDVEAEKIHAGLFCKEIVKKSLKAPSTAKFPWTSDVTTNSGNLVFMVNSYVDAENSFGAKIRTSYHCRLKYNGGGTDGWTIDDFGTSTP